MTDEQKREAVERLYRSVKGKGPDDLESLCDELSQEIASIGQQLNDDAKPRKETAKRNRKETGGLDRSR